MGFWVQSQGKSIGTPFDHPSFMAGQYLKNQCPYLKITVLVLIKKARRVDSFHSCIVDEIS
jgi:hypothetical protein